MGTTLFWKTNNGTFDVHAFDVASPITNNLFPSYDLFEAALLMQLNLQI